MKSFIKVFCTMLLIAVGATASARPVFEVKTVANKSFVLSFQEEQVSEVKIRLKDRKGIILVSENIDDASQYAKKYNLAALASGEYSLVIENETTVRVQPIIVGVSGLEINISDQKTIIKPRIRRFDEKVEVLMMIDEKTWAEMYIFDEKGHTLFEDATNYSETFRRRFDISKLEAGTYVFKVIANDVVVRETIVIERSDKNFFSEH